MRFPKLLAAAVLSVGLLQSASAEFYYPSSRLSFLGPMSVELRDSAINACWTNLTEVREYAEEKLRMRGVPIVSNQRAVYEQRSYNLVIEVVSERNTRGCYGAILLSVSTWITRLDGVERAGKLELAKGLWTTIQSDNVNRATIEAVGIFIDELD